MKEEKDSKGKSVFKKLLVGCGGLIGFLILVIILLGDNWGYKLGAFTGSIINFFYELFN